MAHAIDTHGIPQNVEAEVSVLGSMIADSSCIDEVVAVLPDACAFYRANHRQIYWALVAMHRAGVPIDHTTFSEWIQRDELRRGLSHDFDATDCIVELYSSVPCAANAVYYAKIVREHHQRTRIAAAAAHAGNRCVQEVGPEALAETAGTLRGEIDEAMEWGASAQITPVGQLARQAVEAGKEKKTRLSLGMDSLTWFSPFRGEYLVIGARPSTGKTTLLLQLAWNAACRGQAALVFSQEMPAQDLALRLMAMLTGMQIYDLRTGNYGPEWEADHRWAQEQIAQVDGLLQIAPRQASIDAMNAEVKRFRRKCKEAALVLVDYVQLVESGGRGETRHEQIGYVSAGCNTWKHDGLAVVVASQLNRDQAKSDREPQLTDLRECGKIEEDADIVWLLHNTSKPKGPEVRQVDVICAKNRNGATGRVSLTFDPKAYRFTDPTEQIIGGNVNGYDS